MKTALFCDFDGTISRRDVGYAIFNHYSEGKNDELLPDWKDGKLSTRDCLLFEAAMVKASAKDVYNFIDRFEIDDSFNKFVKLCENNCSPLFIVSDGLDFYIDYILKKHNLSHLNYVANTGKLENDGITIDFPHQNETCPRCGICKGEQIKQFRNKMKDKYRIIFVGDGYSDTCAVSEADVVFAKKDLEQYCLSNKISYYKYETFDDVSQKIVELSYMAFNKKG